MAGKAILVANWKMNPPSIREAKKLFEATRKAAEAARNVSVIVAPPATFLREIAHAYKGRKISFASQNAHFEDSGAYTGEVSVVQVKDAGASSLIIGHAERRAMGEDNDTVRQKVFAALKSKLTAIVCVGEKTRTADAVHLGFVREQLRTALAGVPVAMLSRILIAYEPVWAIGASEPARPRDMHEMSIFIRKVLVELMGAPGMGVKILYGGSVDDTNARDMVEHGEVQGLLVGRASSEPEKIVRLITALN